MSSQETPKKDPSLVEEELSEEQLEQVAGGGGQPHMIGALIPAAATVELNGGTAPVFQKAVFEQKV